MSQALVVAALEIRIAGNGQAHEVRTHEGPIAAIARHVKLTVHPFIRPLVALARSPSSDIMPMRPTQHRHA